MFRWPKASGPRITTEHDFQEITRVNMDVEDRGPGASWWECKFSVTMKNGMEVSDLAILLLGIYI